MQKNEQGKGVPKIESYIQDSAHWHSRNRVVEVVNAQAPTPRPIRISKVPRETVPARWETQTSCCLFLSTTMSKRNSSSALYYERNLFWYFEISLLSHPHTRIGIGITVMRLLLPSCSINIPEGIRLCLENSVPMRVRHTFHGYHFPSPSVDKKLLPCLRICIERANPCVELLAMRRRWI